IYVIPKGRTKRKFNNRVDVQMYHPTSFMQEVFSEVFDLEGLEEHERDEPRKIFISYFRKYYEVIKKNKHCSHMIVNIPGIGQIVPYYNLCLNQITQLSKGEMLKGQKDFKVERAFCKMLEYALKLEDKFVKFYNQKIDSDAKKIGIGAVDRRVKTHSGTWSKNFRKRGVVIERLQYLSRDDNSKGFLF